MVAHHVLGPVSGLAAQVNQTGHGTYLLTEYSEKQGSSGQSRLQLTLEDATGRVTAIVWPEHRPNVLVPPIPSPVSVLAKVQIFDGKVHLRLECLAGLEADQVPCAAALLPRRRCPEIAHASQDRLIALERDLPAPLDGFLKHVLLDHRIGIPLLRCRGSVRDHHPQVGGLLVHCTEHLDLAAAITRTALPTDVRSPHIAQLGYLLHDIGKLSSVGETCRAKHGLVVRHEFLTIEMLAPHLAWLERRNADLAASLRYVFAHLATPFKARKIPEYFVAEVVTTLDHWSAAAHKGRDMGHLLRGGAHASLKNTNVANAANDSHFEPEIRDAG